MGAGALVGLGTEYFCCIIFTTARSYALYVVLRAKHYFYLSKILYNFPPAFFIKVGIGKGYDGHVVKGISKTTIFEKNDALSL